jgi:ABC-type dipeptide/oligopeptide/nickel transport system permease component
MWKFVATAKQFLWEFVELGFLAVLALVLISLLLGPNAGTYVTSVADNVTKFATASSSGMIGIVIVLAIIYFVLRKANWSPRK